MKHFYSVIILPVLVALTLAGCAMNSFAPATSSKAGSPNAESAAGKAIIPDSKEWEPLGKTRTGDCYYKVKRTDDASNIVTVSTYKIVTDDYRKNTIEKLNKLHPDLSKNYENFDHNIRVDEIDCKNKRYRMKEIVDYDNQGQVLRVNPHHDQEWQHIPILTGLDKLRQKLCEPEVKPAEPKKPSLLKKLFKKKK
ncbi:MAG: hypothetical protein H6Q49_857 [Deltaproteobacteria bacterium]|nr:hypothetical protein [Deltaproteobacteria bacterium]